MPQIRVPDTVKNSLDILKEHNKEPYGDVIERLVALQNRKVIYEEDFKTWIHDTMKEHYPDSTALHVTECSSGLQVFFEKTKQNNIVIPHDELKLWNFYFKEGLEPSKKGYSLITIDLLQSIDQKIR